MWPGSWWCGRSKPGRASGSYLRFAFRAFLAAAACAAAVVFPEALGAQTSVLVVRVTGPYGPVGGARVEVLYQEEVLLGSDTGSNGLARLGGVPGGTFRVRVQALGFETTTVENVRITPGESQALEIQLAVAPIQVPGLTVRASPIQIRLDNTDYVTQVEERTIELLPIPYDVMELVTLTPGVREENAWGGANFQANVHQIDGLGANHPGLGGSLFEPSPNWIERVEVRGLGAGADQGGFQGGLVNVVTKSGSNDFSAMLRTMLTHDALSASNLVLSEIGSEVKNRVDLEGEVRGAIVPDRLLYYVGGTYIDRSARVLNHVDFEGRYLPAAESRSEQKVFGKLTWTPQRRDRIDLSGAFFGKQIQNYDLTGYEGPGATSDYTAPTWFGSVGWRRTLSRGAVLEAKLNRFQQDGRTMPTQGKDTPGVQLWAITPPYYIYGNDPLTLRSASSSTSAELAYSQTYRFWGKEHSLKLGGEVTWGDFLDRRTRNGGMTWMPVDRKLLDPENSSTWANPQEGYVPTEWGGEVNLDSEVLNTALSAQAALSFGRLVLTPGVRWGTWRGWMNPVSGDRFQAVEDQALDLRIGATLELTKEGPTVLKGHWGRYHQDLIGQMFDRAGGIGAFTNQEIWYYHLQDNTPLPASFTQGERDALAAQGVFSRESVISLNETGPVVGYRQPYVDQWLVGLERQFGPSVKFEALYTHRSNHDMIALVDRNRDTNYTHFERVRVHMGGSGGQPLLYAGTRFPVTIQDLYVPNYIILEEARYCAANPSRCELEPGFPLADTVNLSWNPDYVLTTAPDATRRFWQVQLGFEFSFPEWGGTLSMVFTGLKGNLDNVSGYADPAEFGPGPYVHLNEGSNSFGFLPNFARKEGKASFWGLLPGGFRGGVFFTSRSGDHYAPQFRLSAQRSQYGYRANALLDPTCPEGDPNCDRYPGGRLPIRFFQPLEGQDVFIGPRGGRTTDRYTNLDLRIERLFEFPTFRLGLSLDLFNALGSRSVTRFQNLLNHGQFLTHSRIKISSQDSRKLYAGKWFGSPLERAEPRRLRVGMTVYY